MQLIWISFRKTACTYACINFGEAYCPKEIAGRSIMIDGDIGEVVLELKS